MRYFVVILLLCSSSLLRAAPPADGTQLEAFLIEASRVATDTLPELKRQDLGFGYVAPYYASRMSDTSAGVLVSFTVRDSHKKETLGITEDRVLVIYEDGQSKPRVKRTTIWLEEGLLGVTR